MRINEIFYSVQGEGFHSGRAAIFIRFSGCNLKCSFCDTDHSLKMELSQKEILTEISKYDCKFVVLTGGEPALQVTQEFVSLLQDDGYYVAIESNGTKELPKADWITISPKENWIVKKGNELKLVYDHQNLSEVINGTDFEHYFLQPKSMLNTENVLEQVKKFPFWKISTQMQNVWNIR
ncbi:MAG: 7-carboxy-7-deazaguanine synthase QueE [Bacteroidota bacterium]|nr:7-carboxy-7-deazaguanine synthase QueE [Bacteroidota bacterium]